MPMEVTINVSADAHEMYKRLCKNFYLANKARRRAHAAKIREQKIYRKRLRRRELWRYADG